MTSPDRRLAAVSSGDAVPESEVAASDTPAISVAEAAHAVRAALSVDHRGRPSVRSKMLRMAMERASTPMLRKLATGERTLTPELLAQLARFDELAARMPLPRGTRVEPVTVSCGGTSLRAEWVQGARVPNLRTRVILYLHGGGWLFGGLNSHRAMTSRISSASGVPVLALDYRMVPDVEFDQEIEDCLAGYRWLLGLGVHARDVVIMGDSAGGYLTMATALRAREHGLPMPAALVGISGVYDMDTANKAAHANAERDPAGSLAALEWMMEVVLGGLDPADPRVSPVRADLSGLPATLLTVGAEEVIYADSEELAQLLAAAGVPCTLQVWEGQVHVFQAFGPLVLPEARRGVTAIGKFVRTALTR